MPITTCLFSGEKPADRKAELLVHAEHYVGALDRLPGRAFDQIVYRGHHDRHTRAGHFHRHVAAVTSPDRLGLRIGSLFQQLDEGRDT